MAFRVLGAGNFPSHRTLCEFRRRHLEDGLFVEVWRTGLARFGKLSRDEGASECEQAQGDELWCARRPGV